jgi:hypothetical protein
VLLHPLLKIDVSDCAEDPEDGPFLFPLYTTEVDDVAADSGRFICEDALMFSSKGNAIFSSRMRDNIDDPDDRIFLLDPTEEDDDKTSTFSSLDRFSSNCMAVTSSVFG